MLFYYSLAIPLLSPPLTAGLLLPAPAKPPVTAGLEDPAVAPPEVPPVRPPTRLPTAPALNSSVSIDMNIVLLVRAFL